MKTCSKCQTPKPLDEFYDCYGGKDGKRPDCKICHRTRVKKSYKGAAKSRKRELSRKYAKEHRIEKLLARYGLTAEQHDKLVYDHEGRCGICDNELPLCVDHDHKTGKVRGLLCQKCNRGLGFFADSIASLRAAVTYLGG